MQEKEISQAVIRRMPRYYRYLGELLEDGVERISSNDLSKRMNVTRVSLMPAYSLQEARCHLHILCMEHLFSGTPGRTH